MERRIKAVSDENDRNSDLVEIAKRNGDFSKNYGVFVGACLYMFSVKATRRGFSWWKALIAAGIAATACWLRMTSGN